MSRVIRREWTCERCGKAWVNEITLRAVSEPDPKKVDALIVCPGCGNNYAIMGEPGHEIAGVDTLPRQS
jgi:transcription elongation factor Elf1